MRTKKDIVISKGKDAPKKSEKECDDMIKELLKNNKPSVVCDQCGKKMPHITPSPTLGMNQIYGGEKV